jgi:small conductance mechanosensitive channel
MRPLTLDQIEVQSAAWMVLLERKCLAVRNAEVAALRAETTDDVELYSARAVTLRGERSKLIERVNVVLEALEAKGGDVAAQRAYVTSVVEVPPISDWRAALTTVGAWLTDEEGGRAVSSAFLKAALVLVAAWIAAGLLSRIARTAMSKTKTSALLQDFVVLSVRRGALGLGALIALAKMGLDMGPLLAAIGAAGLVIGLALQGTLSNIASGLLIMTNRPFDVGDLVSTAGVNGFVRGMTLVTTRVETFDNQTIHIPNNKVWGDVIRNATANKTRRIDLFFGISYADDLRRAQRVLLEIVGEHPKILEDPEPVVRVHELGDSSVNFAVWPWVEADDFLEVRWDLTEAVKERFDREGISIPFPQRDVHLYPAGSGTGEVARADSLA